MLCSGTLHQHDNHGNNRNKKPDVTGIWCLNTHFMSFPSNEVGGSDFSFHVPLRATHVSHSSV